jgi:hypothetical protein
MKNLPVFMKPTHPERRPKWERVTALDPSSESGRRSNPSQKSTNIEEETNTNPGDAQTHARPLPKDEVQPRGVERRHVSE